MSSSQLEHPPSVSLLESYEAISGVEHLTPRLLPPKRRQGPFAIALWGKGGSGKSTTAIQLAGVAAFLGHRVLILDVDPQGSVAAWRYVREDDSIAVQSGRPNEVENLLKRARLADFDLVLIDNAPGRTSHIANVAELCDLSIVLARPSSFDLLIGKGWVQAFEQRKLVFVISAAPPPRLGGDSPLVRDARRTLRSLGGRVWRYQLTMRHLVIHSTGIGQAVIETDQRSPATQEYCRLWNSIVNEIGAPE